MSEIIHIKTAKTMVADFKTIPVIDVGPLIFKIDDPKMNQDPDVCNVVEQLDRACRGAGFFYVKGHGISEILIKEVRNATHGYFDLASDEKIRIKLSPATGPATGYRGYQKVGINITKGVLDFHEAIDFYREVKPGMYGDLGKIVEGSNLWPNNPPEFKSKMEEYVEFCKDLSRKLMRGIALALGGPPNLFERSMAGDPFWVMRLIGYPGVPSAGGQQMSLDNDIGCGAHTDYGLLTLLNQDDDINALQVKNKSGEWIWAVPIPGTFVCNIGDMLEILSNGLYESTLHRVINNSPKYRVCAAFFYETNFDASVEPLDICKLKVSEAQKYKRAVYREHLISKVLTNFVL